MKSVLKQLNVLNNRTKATGADLTINTSSEVVFNNLAKVNGFATFVKAGTEWYLVTANESVDKIPFTDVPTTKTSKQGVVTQRKSVKRAATEFVRVIRENHVFNAFNLEDASQIQLGDADSVTTVAEEVKKFVPNYTNVYRLVPAFVQKKVK